MLVTVDGSTILVSPVYSSNAYESILTKVDGKSILVNQMQSLENKDPMLVRLVCDKSTEVSLRQFLKGEVSM